MIVVPPIAPSGLQPRPRPLRPRQLRAAASFALAAERHDGPPVRSRTACDVLACGVMASGCVTHSVSQLSYAMNPSTGLMSESRGDRLDCHRAVFWELPPHLQLCLLAPLSRSR